MNQDSKKQKPTFKDFARIGASAAHNVAHGKFDKAVVGTVLQGIKMAEAKSLFTDDLVHPLVLLEALKTLGVGALTWQPETLMAEIDRKYHYWTQEQVATALEHFHQTGDFKTEVKPLVRQKIYALRTIMTSDTPHTEWHIFEKVGGVFANRVANFSTVEPLSPTECAATIAIIESIRPDEYSSEIRAYIAASCHQDGFYTAAPSRYLKMADGYLQMMNEEETGRKESPEITNMITQKLKTLQANASKIDKVEEDFTTIQAIKLLAVDSAGDSAVK